MSHSDKPTQHTKMLDKVCSFIQIFIHRVDKMKQLKLSISFSGSFVLYKPFYNYSRFEVCLWHSMVLKELVLEVWVLVVLEWGLGLVSGWLGGEGPYLQQIWGLFVTLVLKELVLVVVCLLLILWVPHPSILHLMITPLMPVTGKPENNYYMLRFRLS